VRFLAPTRAALRFRAARSESTRARWFRSRSSRNTARRGGGAWQHGVGQRL